MGSLREYETVFVLHPRLEESQVEEEIEAVRKTIEAGDGDVVDVERWGKRKLAYEVKKVHEGIYTLIRFRSDVKVLQDLERRYRLQEDIVRHLTVVAQGPPREKRLRRGEPAAEETARQQPDEGKEQEEPKPAGEAAASAEPGVGETPATASTSEEPAEGPRETPTISETDSQPS